MTKQDRLNARGLWVRASVALATLVTFGLVGTMFATTSSAAITAVTGSAYGYYSNISLFGGTATTCGSPSVTPCPNPMVTLPSTGSSTPLTASIPSATVVYGPANIFDSGPIAVSTQGTPTTGSVTSSSSIAGCTTAVSNGCNVGQIYAGPLTATSLSSTCTANGPTPTGSTTVVGGTLLNGTSPAYVIPADPPPNDTFTGTNPDTGATYKWVFNEQTLNTTTGVLTVNAAHEYLNSNASGDLILGQVVCGVTGTPNTTTSSTTSTTVAPTTTTTVAPTTTTTVAPTNTDAAFANLLSAVRGVGPGNSLAAKVSAAQSFFDNMDIPNACGMMNAFIHEVQAQSGRQITMRQAQTFISDALHIRSLMGC